MAITFSGLASGLDTGTIVTELMNLERAPIERLEADQTYYNSRLKAFSEFETKLTSFMDAAETIDTVDELDSPSVTSSSDEFLTASADSDLTTGSFQVTVMALAQQQKDVSGGYADKFSDTFGTGSLSLTVGGEAHSIAIDSENNSLDGIAQAINDADLGVSATIINDGTGDTPYRLILTGENVSESFTLDSSGLSGGSDTAPTTTTTQTAQQSHIVIDGIDVYGDSNSLDSSIPGLTMELVKADPDSATTLNVSPNHDETQTKIKSFVDAYNKVINFISDQSETGWGNDSAFRSVKRSMQAMLTDTMDTGGSYSSLAQIGFETQRDGTVTLDTTTLSDALDSDYDSVAALLTGSGDEDGITDKFAAYLDEMTDSVDGIYAGRKESTESTIKRLDTRIEMMELRMEQREETLRAKFSAMETLVSGLNSQGSFLTQQLSALNS